jgi:hypothetical protein
MKISFVKIAPKGKGGQFHFTGELKEAKKFHSMKEETMTDCKGTLHRVVYSARSIIKMREKLQRNA